MVVVIRQEVVMKRVYKYSIPITDEFDIDLPKGIVGD